MVRAEALQAAGADQNPIVTNPWRSDDARNAALALVPGDVDISLGFDSVLTASGEMSPGLRGGPTPDMICSTTGRAGTISVCAWRLDLRLEPVAGAR